MRSLRAASTTFAAPVALFWHSSTTLPDTGGCQTRWAPRAPPPATPETFGQADDDQAKKEQLSRG
eukprot:6945103-Pyramimonas_sp.AAC.1